MLCHTVTLEQKLLNNIVLILLNDQHNMSDNSKPKPISLRQLLKSLCPKAEKTH